MEKNIIMTFGAMQMTELRWELQDVRANTKLEFQPLKHNQKPKQNDYASRTPVIKYDW